MGGEERLGQPPLDSQPEQLVDDTVLSADILLNDPLDLAFTEHMHRFIALDGFAL
jgi:hypothetical protein